MGVVHRNLSIAQQAGEIDKVKRSRKSGMIVDPVTIDRRSEPIAAALEVMRRYKISGRTGDEG